MNSILELSRYKRAHLWIDELPDAQSVSFHEVSKVIEAKGFTTVKSQQVAVEIAITTGPRTLYGLLGGEFIPRLDGECVIQVLVSSVDDLLMNDSQITVSDIQGKQTANLELQSHAQIRETTLTLSSDQVLIGLPDEYVEAVLEGVLSQGACLPAGVLRINRAAHSLIGSNEMTFAKLGCALVRLLGLLIHNASYTGTKPFILADKSVSNPTESSLELNLIQFALGNITEAIQSLNLNIELDTSLTHRRSGLLRLSSGDPEGAAEDLTQALRIGPSSADDYYNRGLSYFRLGKSQLAIEDWTQAIHANPYFVDAYYNRGQLFFNLGNYEKALVDMQRAEELYSKSSNESAVEEVRRQIRKLQGQIKH